ncbi:MAG: hypothetical protein JWM88_2652 [Verrucomicrobia bacterium]|nr:hypothetical protein [Verrucomicrobiota bacterium]
MKAVGIIGCGELGRQILAQLGAVHPPGKVFRFDDPRSAKGEPDAFPFEAYLEPRFADADFYVGLGYRHLPLRAEIIRALLAAGRRVPALVHPSCHVAPSARIGAGSLVYPLCNLDHQVELEAGVMLNNSVVISHDSKIGAAACLSPGVVVAGYVTIGTAAFLGAGTLVADHRRVGARAIAGIGTVITQDVPDDASVVGNPQRLLDRPLSLG